MTGLPRACLAPTIFAGSPATRSSAPTLKRSGASLASSTTNDPSRPWDFPTRPTTTVSGAAKGELFEELGRFLGRRGGPLLRPAAAGDVARLVLRPAALDLRPEQPPVGNG